MVDSLIFSHYSQYSKVSFIAEYIDSSIFLIIELFLSNFIGCENPGTPQPEFTKI